MPDIHIHRQHDLGLAKAREIADAWAKDVKAQFDMVCDVARGKTTDTISFKRSGVSGTLVVAADQFDLNAKLGFLLGVFAKTIEEQIQQNLDGQLAMAQAQAQAQAQIKTKADPSTQPAAKAVTKAAPKASGTQPVVAAKAAAKKR